MDESAGRINGPAGVASGLGGSKGTLGRYDAMVARLCESVLRSPSDLDAERREAAARGALAGPAAPLVRKVRDASYKVTDEDFAALKAGGFSEEQLFDLTVSAALGAARERLERVNVLLRGERSA